MACRLIFDCRFGGGIGWGHVVRCSAIAEEAKRRGCHCVLKTDSDVAALAPDVAGVFDEQTPSPDVLPRIHSENDWVVIDRYDCSDTAVARWKLGGYRIMVIHDLLDQHFPAADLVLNSLLGLESADYGSGPRLLLGELFAPVRRAFLLSRDPEDVPSPYCLVIPGGTDVASLSIDALDALEGTGLTPVLILNRRTSDAVEIQKRLDRFDRSVWVDRQSAAQLANWMRGASVGLTTCGSAVYEYSAVGLPFVSVVAADNQRKLGEAIKGVWNLPVLARDKVSSEALRQMLTNLVSRERASPWPMRCDGLGAGRIADAMGL